MAGCDGACAWRYAPLIGACALVLGMRWSLHQRPLRLPTAVEEAGGCEEFFLLDGRPPVELPDTWGEARAAFREMCGQDGYSSSVCTRLDELLFDSAWKDSDAPLDASPELCESLLRLAMASDRLVVEPGDEHADDAASAFLLGADKQTLFARAAVQGQGLGERKSLDNTATAKVTKGGVQPGKGAQIAMGASWIAEDWKWIVFVVLGLVLCSLRCLLSWLLPPWPRARGAEGELHRGMRVTTQWTRGEGGDDQWYVGYVKAVKVLGIVTIAYDDQTFWTGRACFVYPEAS